MRARWLFIPACGLALWACGGDDTGAGPSDASAHPDTSFGNDSGNGTDASDAGASTDADAGPDTIVPNHIFVIMMENNSPAHVLTDVPDATPYINSVAANYGKATNYFGVTHPSEPNYLATISGSTFGQFDDNAPHSTIPADASISDLVNVYGVEFLPGTGDGTDVDGGPYLSQAQITAEENDPHWFDATNLVDQLEAAHKTWRAYMESMPSAGFLDDGPPIDVTYKDAGKTARLYRVKHNPFVYFSDIAGDVDGGDGGANPRLQNVVPFSQLATDLAGSASSIPNFVWITPNMCNDMHGVDGHNPDAGIPVECDDQGLWSGPNGSAVVLPPLIALGDTFLKNTVGAIQASAAWKNDNTAIVIVWDEDEYLSNQGTWKSPTNGTDAGTQGGGPALALVLTSYRSKPVTFALPANHYTLLATIQSLWGLPCLQNSCGVADAGLLMVPLFQP